LKICRIAVKQSLAEKNVIENELCLLGFCQESSCPVGLYPGEILPVFRERMTTMPWVMECRERWSMQAGHSSAGGGVMLRCRDHDQAGDSSVTLGLHAAPAADIEQSLPRRVQSSPR